MTPEQIRAALEDIKRRKNMLDRLLYANAKATMETVARIEDPAISFEHKALLLLAMRNLEISRDHYLRLVDRIIEELAEIDDRCDFLLSPVPDYMPERL